MCTWPPAGYWTGRGHLSLIRSRRGAGGAKVAKMGGLQDQDKGLPFRVAKGEPQPLSVCVGWGA